MILTHTAHLILYLCTLGGVALESDGVGVCDDGGHASLAGRRGWAVGRRHVAQATF